MNELKHKHRKILKPLVVGVILMFGFAYLLVPLYTLVCKQAGINGRSDNRAVSLDPHLTIDTSRTIDVQMTTTVHGDLTFDFQPLTRHLQIHPGETKLVYFYVKNRAKEDITVQAIPSVTPNEVAKYLKKTECFCFTQQRFLAGEQSDMPVYFYIDPAVPKDAKYLTLSYTLFDARPYLKKSKARQIGRIDL